MVKNQHYVPRFYLRNFCVSKQQIAVFDKSKKTNFKTSIDNIANENYFYDDEYVDKHTKTKQFLEKFFHPMENKISVILPNLIKELSNNSFSMFSTKLRLEFAFYIIYQYCRTKEFREQINQSTKLFTQTVADDFIKSQGANPEDFEIVTDDKILHIDFLLNNDVFDKLIEDIFDHIWIILVNESDIPFITSDHPVVKHSNISHPVLSYTGLKSPGIEIAFPLSPKYCLLLAERSYSKIFEPFEDRKMHANKDNVMFYNSLQVIQSYRYIFSSSSDFKMAEEILEDEPELQDMKRARIWINKS